MWHFINIWTVHHTKEAHRIDFAVLCCYLLLVDYNHIHHCYLTGTYMYDCPSTRSDMLTNMRCLDIINQLRKYMLPLWSTAQQNCVHISWDLLILWFTIGCMNYKWWSFWKFRNIEHNFIVTSDLKISPFIMQKSIFNVDNVIDDVTRWPQNRLSILMFGRSSLREQVARIMSRQYMRISLWFF